jgi:hypothetical protein
MNNEQGIMNNEGNNEGNNTDGWLTYEAKKLHRYLH